MTVSRLTIAENGPEFSRIIPGLMRVKDWGLSAEGLRDWIHACLDMGITTFDHADIYGDYEAEEIFGAALALDPALRDKMELVTKCGIKLVSPNRPEHRLHTYDTSKDHIIASAERSLKNLKTDRIDVLLIHRPDPIMDADEMAEALTILRNDGKILYAGVSNFLPHQHDLLQSRLDFPLVTNQIEFSVMQTLPLYDGRLDQCQELRRAPMIWSPIAGGRMFTGTDERATRVRDALTQIGEELGGAPMDQVALAWIMMHPARPMPVVGTGKLERIRGAVESDKLTMSREQWFVILEASHGHEVP